MRAHAIDPNTSQQEATQSNLKALLALDELQVALNTIYAKIGRTQPVGTLTDQQLTNMGIT